ncbi:leucine-rich repeat-containing G-protein coupled receptor 6-like [Athalia rosae]|uniref:leucine-rich repeat-containing G-protein coupled receptor 6-like n=1 Tax=Athalia rosae TaxID=37344 RepID=UPI00203482EF|nr:leucine-rich repeat-containing G-protein coupled receptor 6-like [Athalia rosae]
MMFLRIATTVCIVVVGVAQSLEIDSSELLNSKEEAYPAYRPWEHDESNTTWISLAGMGISSVSSTFRLHIPDLKWLVMDDNAITAISTENFKHFPDLTYLSLAGNRIRSFVDSGFGFLDKLQVLDLDRNPIADDSGYADPFGSSRFSSLPALQSLYLRNCNLRRFHMSESTNNLSHLYLTGNQLVSFYATTDSSLTHLYLDDTQLRYVSLREFPSLLHLDVKNNLFTGIASLSRMSTEEHLRDLRNGNYYHNRPAVLYLERSPNLKYLIASSNKITEIDSDSFIGMEALTHVDLSLNQINTLQAGTFDSLLNLEDILLDSNKIIELNHRAFNNLPSLKTITLRNNEISDINEDAFAKLNSSASEIHLFLDNNQIRTLNKGSFSNIKGLKHIGLSGNKISTISSLTFINLPSLGSIEIQNQSLNPESPYVTNRWGERVLAVTNSPSRNPFSYTQKTGTIESNAFFNLTNLTLIRISGNSFTHIEEEAFHSLPKLLVLDLSNNNIERLPSTAFTDLANIEYLYLGNNSLPMMLPNTLPKCLKHLDLSHNHILDNLGDWPIKELDQLETLNLSGVIRQLKPIELAGLPANLTIIVNE